MATKNKSRFKLHLGKPKGKQERKLEHHYNRKKLVASKEADAYLVPAILEVPVLLSVPKAATVKQATVQHAAVQKPEIRPLISTNTPSNDQPALNIDFNQSWLKFRKRMRSSGNLDF